MRETLNHYILHTHTNTRALNIYKRKNLNQRKPDIFLPNLSANCCASAPFPDAKLPSMDMILLFSLKREVVLSPRA